MRNLDFDEPNEKPASTTTSTYRVPKKILWAAILVLTAILIVLLVLTIYFGVNQKSKTLTSTIGPFETTTSNAVTTTTSNAVTTTTSNTVTTTMPPLPPVARIPNNLQQQFYELNITPDLTDETFTGEQDFTCDNMGGSTYQREGTVTPSERDLSEWKGEGSNAIFIGQVWVDFAFELMFWMWK
jgi:hypothetical protein